MVAEATLDDGGAGYGFPFLGGYGGDAVVELYSYSGDIHITSDSSVIGRGFTNENVAIALAKDGSRLLNDGEVIGQISAALDVRKSYATKLLVCRKYERNVCLIMSGELRVANVQSKLEPDGVGE